MHNKNHIIISEDEYRKKVLAPLYGSHESREIIIDRGQKQVDELLDTEKKIKEQIEKLEKKYKDI